MLLFSAFTSLITLICIKNDMALGNQVFVRFRWSHDAFLFFIHCDFQ